MSIERVMELMPVPDHVYENNSIDWELIEGRINAVFPADFKDFVSSYGTGVIGNFVWVINPFSSNNNLNIDKLEYIIESYMYMKREFPDQYTRNGSNILPWAVTDNGDSFVWIRNGDDPDRWVVMIHSHDQGEEEETGFTAMEFLVALLEQRIKSNILPEDFLRAEKAFTPLQPRD